MELVKQACFLAWFVEESFIIYSFLPSVFYLSFLSSFLSIDSIMHSFPTSIHLISSFRVSSRQAEQQNSRAVSLGI
jgi:hypothetical protein